MRGLSTAASMAPVEHVVADAGAFLRDAPLQVQEIPPRGAGPGLETPQGCAWGQASVITRPICPQDIGKNIYTIREVVREIRDKATRRRLAVLPYELRFKEPFPEYVRLGECPSAALSGELGRVETDLPSAGRACFKVQPALKTIDLWSYL